MRLRFFFPFALTLARVILTAIVRVHYIALQLRSSDPTFDWVPAGICTQVLMNYSLMAATFPCLKPFVISFNTGWGQGNQGIGSSYVLESFSRQKRDGSRGLKSDNIVSDSKHSKPVNNFPLRPDPHTHNWSIGHDGNQIRPARGEDADGSMTSQESQQMIIRRTAGWSVKYETDDSLSAAPSKEIGIAG